MGTDLFPLLSIVRLRMGTDGSGVSTLVAGAGCPMDCKWCINKKILRHARAEWISSEQLYERVKIDDLYFRATGGGITFGGGEPLLHASFIAAFRKICPPEWRISIESSLCVPPEAVRTAAEAVDEWIIDCKDLDPDRYRNYTGQSILPMKTNLQILQDKVKEDRILVRVPFIPGYNTISDQKKNAALLRSMGFTRIDLFEYVIRGY